MRLPTTLNAIARRLSGLGLFQEGIGLSRAYQTTTRSTTGYIIMLAGAAIVAASRRQHCITMSSCEAELVALCDAAIELLHIVRRRQFSRP